MASSQETTPVSTQATFLPATSQRFYVDLDTAPGAFSQWRPAFGIYLQSDGDPDVAEQLGLQIYAENLKMPMKMKIVGRLGGKYLADIPLRTTLRLNERLNIELKWNSEQVITFILGANETRSIAVRWQVCKAFVTSSTGQLKLEPLTFGFAKL